jgi:cyclopropane-fatty-acyl-phospholipid synthase
VSKEDIRMSQAEELQPRAGASPDALAEHYDAGDAFFRLWLDPEMVYSCPIYADGDDLAAAQLRKLDFHIDAARARGARRVLVIGCGWGALLRRLVQQAGVDRVVGLTLNRSHASWAEACGLPQIEVRREDWRDHAPEAPYDAIISIEAFEHFAHPRMSQEEKLAVYREFFARCHGMLAEGGRLSLQLITYVRSSSSMAMFPDIARAFRESECPVFWEPFVAADGTFELLAVRNDRDDYHRALREWDRNLDRRYAEAVALVGEDTVASFRRYLRIAAMGFRLGVISLLRVSFIKKDQPGPLAPWPSAGYPSP